MVLDDTTKIAVMAPTRQRNRLTGFNLQLHAYPAEAIRSRAYSFEKHLAVKADIRDSRYLAVGLTLAVPGAKSTQQ